MSSRRIAIQQAIIPDYRLGIFSSLKKRYGDDLCLFAGESDFGGSPVSSERAWTYAVKVQNRYLIRGQLLWQSGCFVSLLNSETTILNANMRILSNDLILFLRFLLGRRTILWGHVEGQSAFAKWVRGFYFGLCGGFIAYTEEQANQVRRRHKKLPVWVACNSCVSAADCRPAPIPEESIDSFLYVGRLVKRKKVDFLLEAYIAWRRQGDFPCSSKLVLVGDGELRGPMQQRVQDEGLEGQVLFKGHISDVSELRSIYAKAICATSPGYVGLSAIQAFSFGIPMIISREEFHSPEIEACKEGFNTAYFETDNTGALIAALRQAWADRTGWQTRRIEIAEWTKERYSFEAMERAFANAIEDSA